jgi:hypothetical protein
MFSLFHFSRVFPYIHPYLFPVETPNASETAAAQGESNTPAARELSRAGAEDAAISPRAGQARRLKSLHRRHLRSQRNEVLTYSGAFRHAAW